MDLRDPPRAGDVIDAGTHLGRLGSFGMSAAATFAVAANAYVTSFHAARLGAVLLVLLVMHLLRFASVVFARETLIYVGFLGYMLLELLWTEDERSLSTPLFPRRHS